MADALGVSLAETGRVDPTRIASLLGISEEQARQQLTEGDDPLAFHDPETQRLETRDAYLSGQVRRKLEAAREAGLTANVAALERVQPEPWTAEQVTAKVGSNWIPTDVWEAFYAHVTGGAARVTYHRIANAFEVRGGGEERRLNWDEWGVPNPGGGPSISAADLFTAMMNSRSVRLGVTDEDGRFHLDEAQTELAKMKMVQIAMEFADWVFADGDRRQRLTALAPGAPQFPRPTCPPAAR
jgi:N12 class adenine-specific DNA methylase